MMYESQDSWDKPKSSPNNFLEPPPMPPFLGQSPPQSSANDQSNIYPPQANHSAPDYAFPNTDTDGLNYRPPYQQNEYSDPLSQYRRQYDEPTYQNDSQDLYHYNKQYQYSEESGSFAMPAGDYSSPLKPLEDFRTPEHPNYYSDKSNNPSYPPPDYRPYHIKNDYLEDNTRPAPVPVDPDIPHEIAVLFRTNHCAICNVRLNSRIQSKTHYEGKPHSRTLKARLEKYKKENPNSAYAQKYATPDKSDEPPKKKSKNSYVDATEMYCKCCEISFTSMEHATQHYLGRNHQRVLHNLQPLKTGYFNEESRKWQRAPTDAVTPTLQITQKSNEGEKGRFYCSLCDVATTCQSQLNGHFNGARHKSKLQKKHQLGNNPDGSKRFTGNNRRNRSQKGNESILETVMKDNSTSKPKWKNDLSTYRTPSGQYYCSKCDVTGNTMELFQQHLDSKKHHVFPKKSKS